MKLEKGSNKDKIGRRGTYGENLVNPSTPFLIKAKWGLIWDDLLKMSVNFYDFLHQKVNSKTFTINFLTKKRDVKLQLNKYQTDLYFLESSHQMMNDCLLISGFLHVFDLFCMFGTLSCYAHLNIKTKTILCSCAANFSNLGKFSEINKQFHVKSWLTYRSYISV